MSTDTIGSGRMFQRTTRAHIGGNLLVAGAGVALGITTWRYLTPLSGITGTPGALLTMLGEAGLLLAGLAIGRMVGGTGRTTLIVLAWLGIILTIFAAYLLHGWWTTAVLAAALLGLVIETFASGRRREKAS